MNKTEAAALPITTEMAVRICMSQLELDFERCEAAAVADVPLYVNELFVHKFMSRFMDRLDAGETCTLSDLVACEPDAAQLRAMPVWSDEYRRALALCGFGYACVDKVGAYHKDEDEPAVVEPDGTRKYYKHGMLHRDGDAPAVIDSLGCQYYFKKGNLHRDGNEPAVVRRFGPCEYWNEGTRRRLIELPEDFEPHTGFSPRYRWFDARTEVLPDRLYEVVSEKNNFVFTGSLVSSVQYRNSYAVFEEVKATDTAYERIAISSSDGSRLFPWKPEPKFELGTYRLIVLDWKGRIQDWSACWRWAAEKCPMKTSNPIMILITADGMIEYLEPPPGSSLESAIDVSPLVRIDGMVNVVRQFGPLAVRWSVAHLLVPYDPSDMRKLHIVRPDGSMMEIDRTGKVTVIP